MIRFEVTHHVITWVIAYNIHASLNYLWIRGVRVEHFSYLTVPVPDPCRKMLPDPTSGYTRSPYPYWPLNIS